MANTPLPDYKYGQLQTCLNNYTLARLLAANIAEIMTVPTDENGKLAKVVTFGKGSAADFYAMGFSANDSADRETGGTFPEIAANGTFASDTLWTKGTGWTISGGVATAAGAISTPLSQSSANVNTAIIAGYSYTVTYTITSFTAGTIAVALGSGTAGTARGSAATFIETIVAGSDGTISFTTAGFTGSIDNVTITPWILGAGWTTASNTATATGAISTTISQTANVTTPLVNGQQYLVKFTATQSAGSVAVSLGGGTAGTSRSTSATFSEVITAGSTQAITFTGSGFSGTLSAVTILAAVAVPGDTTNGLAGDQNPSGYFLNCDVSTIAIVSAGTPIVTANFYK